MVAQLWMSTKEPQQSHNRNYETKINFKGRH